jgi:hypothetical protein
MPTLETFRQFAVELIYVFIEAVGGVARYLQKYLEEGEFNIRHFFAHLFVSAFSGYMFGEFGLWVGLGDGALFLLVGMGGYMGTETLKLIEGILKQRLKK